MDHILDKIKNKGYWKIVFHPAEYKENIIPNRETAIKIIEESKVSLRGNSYPIIDPEDGIFKSGNDSVASQSDSPDWGYVEYWQFYQNGSFISYVGMIEDHRLDSKAISKIKESLTPFVREKENLGDKFLNIIHATYFLSEVFLFAANLYSRIDTEENIFVEIELVDVFGRTLYIGDDFFRGSLMRAYTCKFKNENILKKMVYEKEQLISNYGKYAIDMLIEIFADFNWSANRSGLEQDQTKLYERKL